LVFTGVVHGVYYSVLNKFLEVEYAEQQTHYELNYVLEQATIIGGFGGLLVRIDDYRDQNQLPLLLGNGGLSELVLFLVSHVLCGIEGMGFKHVHNLEGHTHKPGKQPVFEFLFAAYKVETTLEEYLESGIYVAIQVLGSP